MVLVLQKKGKVLYFPGFSRQNLMPGEWQSCTNTMLKLTNWTPQVALGFEQAASTLPYRSSCQIPAHILSQSHGQQAPLLLIGGEPRAMTLFSLPSTAHPAWQIPKGLSLYSLLSLAREGAAYSCTLHYPWANAQQVCGQNKNQSFLPIEKSR